MSFHPSFYRIARHLLRATLIVALAAATARADDTAPPEVEAFEGGVTAYEGGRYDVCVQRLGALLAPGHAEAIRDATLRVRARMYFATCLVATRHADEADRQLQQLILEDTRYAPDPAAFPGQVVDRFTAIRVRLRPEIERLENDRRNREEAESRRRDDDRRRFANRLVKLEALARIETVVTTNSRWVAAIPYGAGQFQNRQYALGWVLFGTELSLTAATIVTGALHQSYLAQFVTGTKDPQAAADRSNTVAFVNRVGFFSLMGVAAAGVLHAELSFIPEVRITRPRSIDIGMRPTLAPTPGGALAGLHATF